VSGQYRVFWILKGSGGSYRNLQNMLCNVVLGLRHLAAVSLAGAAGVVRAARVGALRGAEGERRVRLGVDAGATQTPRRFVQLIWIATAERYALRGARVALRSAAAPARVPFWLTAVTLPPLGPSLPLSTKVSPVLKAPGGNGCGPNDFSSCPGRKTPRLAVTRPARAYVPVAP
jgi:hypothetical protein